MYIALFLVWFCSNSCADSTVNNFFQINDFFAFRLQHKHGQTDLPTFLLL